MEWKRLVAARSHFLTVVVLINFHILPRLFSLAAADMNSEHLRWFVKDVLETPPKRGNQQVQPRRSIHSLTEEERRKRKKTINALIGLLRMALTMAWENGKIDTDRPWRCLRRLPNVDRPRMLHLSRAECFRLLDHCQPDLRRLVLGALYTGCRITELLRIQASHVGRDGAGVYITPVKSHRTRVVLLPDEGLAFFKSLAAGKRPDEFLFFRDDGRGWFTNYRHAFKNAIEQVLSRGTFASTASDIPTLASLLRTGHLSLSLRSSSATGTSIQSVGPTATSRLIRDLLRYVAVLRRWSIRDRRKLPAVLGPLADCPLLASDLRKLPKK